MKIVNVQENSHRKMSHHIPNKRIRISKLPPLESLTTIYRYEVETNPTFGIPSHFHEEAKTSTPKVAFAQHRKP